MRRPTRQTAKDVALAVCSAWFWLALLSIAALGLIALSTPQGSPL